MKIQVDDLSDGKVIELLEEHHREMHLYSPVESIHALDHSKFRHDSLTFWSVRHSGKVAACGALMHLPEEVGEIKSMRTRAEHHRKGLAGMILKAIVKEAELRSYQRLSLETGTNKAFLPAIKLYQKYGFKECGPFADYKVDSHSMFLSKEISR